MISGAAILYAVICTGVIAFQLCLMAGAPWGHVTQGGQHAGTLPLSGKAIAAISVPLLVFMAASTLSAADIGVNWPRWTSWTALGIQSLSTLLNWITPSRPERLLWGPLTSVMLALMLLVNLG